MSMVHECTRHGLVIENFVYSCIVGHVALYFQKLVPTLTEPTSCPQTLAVLGSCSTTRYL